MTNETIQITFLLHFKVSSLRFKSSKLSDFNLICGRERIHDLDWNIIHIWQQNELVNLFLQPLI